MRVEIESQPIVSGHPSADASVDVWVEWFWSRFLPGWVQRATDPEGFGFFDQLGHCGEPSNTDRRTVLSQARLLFTFSHLALGSRNPVFRSAATTARDAIDAFRKSPGLYSRARAADRSPTGDRLDDLAYSYDQSFVILGLSTWGRLNPDEDVSAELEACWAAIETRLVDWATGMLVEHDGLVGSDPALYPHFSQNPHMHLYEAALQAYEMTQDAVWLERACRIRLKGLEYFFDTSSGTVTEFITPELSALPGRDGERREIGHQCEWAWLLLREVELGGDANMLTVAERLLEFADTAGYATSGVMAGAALDAVSADQDWCEERFLLWPQTEAIKAFAVRKNNAEHANAARDLTRLMFTAYFAGRAAFINQLDACGSVLWADALSRLHYHVVLALTEGARAGLWPGPE